MAEQRLYPGWSAEVQEVMDEGLGGLGIPARNANRLEDEGVLTVYDLLLRTPNQLIEQGNLGDRSFNDLKVALRRKGFRRARGKRYNPDEPLFRMYEGCFPEQDDPSDLLADTPTIDSDEAPQLLTHKQALERAIEQLEAVKTHFGKKTKQFNMLKWIIYYARTRLPEPEEEE